jgi:CDP-6-deoxy-D-xylo-4-hexulose-3-dehydrase
MVWPLNVSNFTLFDKLKICAFFLNPRNFWTQSKKVQEFEQKMANFMGFKYSVFVSSGSTANTILAMHVKDQLVKANKFQTRNIVVLPSTTWQTSCSPWIREGFNPHFIDVSMENFGMDLIKLNEFLLQNSEKVAAVFPTSLLGFNLNYRLLKNLSIYFPDIEFCIDQCENNFAGFENFGSDDFTCFTSTTSTYMGHQIQSVEGGFVFTNNQNEYEKFLMYRNHGMVRSLNGTEVESAKGLYENKKVDSRFDFYSLGNNFRNSDIHAFLGLLDLKKAYKYIRKRREIYGVFNEHINKNRYLIPEDSLDGASWRIPFAPPLFVRETIRRKGLIRSKNIARLILSKVAQLFLDF